MAEEMPIRGGGLLAARLPHGLARRGPAPEIGRPTVFALASSSDLPRGDEGHSNGLKTILSKTILLTLSDRGR